MRRSSGTVLWAEHCHRHPDSDANISCLVDFRLVIYWVQWFSVTRSRSRVRFGVQRRCEVRTGSVWSISFPRSLPQYLRNSIFGNLDSVCTSEVTESPELHCHRHRRDNANPSHFLDIYHEIYVLSIIPSLKGRLCLYIASPATLRTGHGNLS